MNNNNPNNPKMEGVSEGGREGAELLIWSKQESGDRGTDLAWCAEAAV